MDAVLIYTPRDDGKPGDSPADRVAEVLRAAGYTCTRLGSWPEVEGASANGRGAAVVLELGSDLSWDPWWVERVLRLRRRTPTFIVTDGGVSGQSGWAAALPGNHVIRDEELDRLPCLIAGVPFERFFGSLETAIRRGTHLHVRLRQALARTVERQPRTGRSASDGQAPFHTVRELAEEVRLSRRYVTRLGSDIGIPMGAWLDWILVIRALELTFACRCSQRETALRLGFRHPSSVSELVLRITGMRPSMLETRDVPGVLARFWHRFGPGLAGGETV